MLSLKKCKKCSEEKSLTEYYKVRKYKGKQYYQAECKLCQIKRSREWKEQNWDKHKKYIRKIYHQKKLDYWIVYLIPGVNYVGKTNHPENRMAEHRFTNRFDTTDWKILHNNLSEKEALKIEASYHDKGYIGKKGWKK